MLFRFFFLRFQHDNLVPQFSGGILISVSIMWLTSLNINILILCKKDCAGNKLARDKICIEKGTLTQ